MGYFSQIDPRWSKNKIGLCNQTIGQVGCLITSCSNILKRLGVAIITPDELNKLAIKKGWYSNGCMLSLDKLAAYYGLKYTKQIKLPEDVCIFETNYYKKVGVPQHFVMFNPGSGLRIDPLDADPSWENNNYPMVSYRVFTKPKIEPEQPKTAQVVQDTTKQQNVSYTNIQSVSEPINTISEAIKVVNSSDGEEKSVIKEVEPQETVKLSELPKIEPTLFQRFIELITNLIK